MLKGEKHGGVCFSESQGHLTGALSCEYLGRLNPNPRQDSFDCYCSEDKREVTKVILSWEDGKVTSDISCGE